MLLNTSKGFNEIMLQNPCKICLVWSDLSMLNMVNDEAITEDNIRVNVPQLLKADLLVHSKLSHIH